jgi:hypothetical protein
MGGCEPATIMGRGVLMWVNAACVTELPHTALNEVETHFIKRLVHHLYLTMWHKPLSLRQIIQISLQIRIL